MAVEHYPRYIDVAGKQFKVADGEEHLQRFPEDHKRFTQELVNEEKTDTAITVLEAKERERCARIAENVERGNKLGIRIASAIRKAGPLVDEFPVVVPVPGVDPVPESPAPKPFPSAPPHGPGSVQESLPKAFQSAAPIVTPGQEPLPKAFQTAVPLVSPPYPKVLANPNKSSSAIGLFTVKQPDNTWTQPDKRVENADEEAAARKLGFVTEVPAPVPALQF